MKEEKKDCEDATAKWTDSRLAGEQLSWPTHLRALYLLQALGEITSVLQSHLLSRPSQFPG